MALRKWFAKAEPHGIDRSPPDGELESDIIFVLRTIFDPEIPVNIYDLGLIYELRANPENGHVHIRMTLTAPGCPVAQSFPEMVADTVREVPGVEAVAVELVWEPRWSKQMMSEAARLQLGLL
jgi:FeS assembly SUF system protein